MLDLIEILLFPDRIGNAAHGFAVAFAWLFLAVIIFGGVIAMVRYV